MASPINARLVRRAAATKFFLVAVAVIGIIQSFLVLGQATLLARSIAHVFDTHDVAGVTRDAGLLVLIFAGRGVLTWLTSWFAQRASADVKSQLRRDVMAARLDNPVLTRTPTGSLITIVTQGLDALDGYFSKYLPQFILAATVPIVIGVAVGFSDLRSVLIVVLTMPLIPLFMILIGWTTSQRVARRWSVQTRLANYFADLVAGLPTLQVFGRARAQLKGLERTEAAHRTETLSTLRVAFLSAFVLELLATLSVALIAVTVGLRTLSGDVDLQTALYVLILAPEIYLPIRMVGVHFHDSANGTAAADAAFAVIDAAKEETGGDVAVPDLGTCAIEFEDVSYSYPGASDDQPNAVDGFSMRLAPGEVVALAGPSGAGKSTVLGILGGFLNPTSGRVLVGGVPLGDLDVEAWRHQLAWVSQEPGMLNGTVADNIRLGNPGSEPAELREILDQVGGAAIPLDQSVGDDGVGLSAGERRRVGLARALLRIHHGARLLVLDEPTAGLDHTTEVAAIRAIRALRVGALVVTHRPIVLDLVDRVAHIEAPAAAVASGADAATPSDAEVDA